MLKINFKFVKELQNLDRARKRSTKRYLFSASGYVRTVAKNSLGRTKKKSKASPPGQPPNSQTSALRKGIVYSINMRNETSIIGPMYKSVGPSGALHEFGGRRKGQKYPSRAFMRPALDKFTNSDKPEKFIKDTFK